MIIDGDRFLSGFPLIITAALGALNDNLIKAAIIVFAAMSVGPDQAANIGLAAGGLLMAPFVLFSGWAGALADKIEKATLIRIVKYSELALACLATGAMLTGSIPLMLAIVFLMGTQSTFFGPLKLGWIPERLLPSQLVAANGWLETLTFLGILGGTVAGGLLAGPETLIWAGVSAIGIALLGVSTAHLLPVKHAAAPDIHVPRNPLAGATSALKALMSDRIAGRAVLLEAWFWAAGSVYLSTLPAYLRAHLGADETLVALVLGLFAGGIGIGSVLASRMLKGRVGTTAILPAVLIVCFGAFAVWVGFGRLVPGSGMTGLLQTPEGIFVIASLALVAIGGGMFAVPLKALIQSRAEADSRGRTMAGYNILTAAAIAGTSGLVALAISAGMGLSEIFLVVAITSIGATAAAVAFFPRAALQSMGRLILCRLLRVEVEGAEHLATNGPVVFVSNHVSFADGPLLFSLIERNAAIAVNTGWANGRILGKIARVLNIAALDPQSPMAAKSLAQDVQSGKAALVFPEGRVSTHGNLMKVYPGTAWLVDAAQAPVVPITIHGLEGSIFTRSIPGMARRIFPRVRIHVGAPRRLDVSEDLRGATRRQAATRALQDMLEDARYEMLAAPGTLPAIFSRSREILDRKSTAVSDPMGTSLTRGRLATGAAAFSRLLQERTDSEERVGVLLPGVAGAAVVLMGLWRAGRVAAILNPTLGPAPMLSAIETGQIKRLLTSRDFVAKAELESVIAHLEEKGIEILWTDDLKAQIGVADKLRAAIAAGNPADVHLAPDDPAVVLFTSGTEGAPKGVVLTHANLVSNIAQLRARTDVGSRDRVLSAMPLFHSFGLTGGLLLPLMTGAPVMLYPTPLHYKIVPEMAYAHQATLIFGTDTFLTGWGKRADAYDFSSLRAAIAGAEPVKDSTRKLWSEKFGVRILEGYGATEAGPVIALNTPMESRSGTVGRPLPRLAIRLEEVPGIDGKRLWIRGPNIMAGYLMPGGDGTLQAPDAGWYDTGDIVQVDADGFISIVGRLKRFAKIGGEMVSLAAVETLAAKAWPNAHVAALSRPDDRKGEKVVVVTTEPGASKQAISAVARDDGISEIFVPSEVIVRQSIPVLASGKTDYPGLDRALAETGDEVAA